MKLTKKKLNNHFYAIVFLFSASTSIMAFSIALLAFPGKFSMPSELMSVLSGEFLGLQISGDFLLLWNFGIVMTAGMVGRLLAGFVVHFPIKFNDSNSNSPNFVLSRIGSVFLFGLLGSSAYDIWRLFQKSPDKDSYSQDKPTSILILKNQLQEEINKDSVKLSYATIQNSIRSEFSSIDFFSENPEREAKNLEILSVANNVENAINLQPHSVHHLVDKPQNDETNEQSELLP